MKSSPLVHACATAILLASVSSVAAANLFTNSSFEQGSWTGLQAFVNPNNSTELTTAPALTGWQTNPNTYWVEDPSRTPLGGGNRMLWLGPPSATNTCVTQTLDLFSIGNPQNQLVGLQTYRLSIDYAFFNPTNLSPAPGTPSALQIHYVMYSGGVPDPGSYYYFPEDPGDPTTPTNITGTLSPWTTSGASGLGWTTATFDFVLPDVTGYDQIKFCFSAPFSTPSTPSAGVLVDRAGLTVVPEPTSLLLSMIGGGLALRRRRARA
jgi:hypothetical protein